MTKQLVLGNNLNQHIQGNSMPHKYSYNKKYVTSESKYSELYDYGRSGISEKCMRNR